MEKVHDSKKEKAGDDSKAILETKDGENVHQEEVEYEQKEVSVGRIMGFYRPIYLTWVGVLISVICALSWPAYGLIYSKLLFVMMSFSNPFYHTFSEDRAFYCGMFLLLIGLMGIFFFI